VVEAGRCRSLGRSIFRPIVGLLLTWLASALLFQRSADTQNWIPSGEALSLAASHLFPFFPWSRSSRDEVIKHLYGSGSEIHLSIEVIAYAESFFALLFIFLLGLALRNRLRL
jgi:hypothetical protein